MMLSTITIIVTWMPVNWSELKLLKNLMFKANFNTSWLRTRWVRTSEQGMTYTVDANVV